jgi:hypothetical protein
MREKCGIVSLSRVADMPPAIEQRLDQLSERAPPKVAGCDLQFGGRATDDPVPCRGEARRLGPAAQAIGRLARHPHPPRRRADRLTDRVNASAARNPACRRAVHPSRRSRTGTGRKAGTRGWKARRGRRRG